MRDMKAGKRKRHPDFWWFIHNVIAHPVGELFYWVGLNHWGEWLHDETLPEHEAGTGRG